VAGGHRNSLSVSPPVRQLAERANDYRLRGQLRTGEQVVKFLGDTVKTRPVLLARMVFWKAKRAWYGTDSHRSEETLLAWLHGIYLVFMVVGAVLLGAKPGFGRRWLIFSSILVLYYWAMTVVVLSIARYMLPAFGIMFVWQAALLERCRVWQLRPKALRPLLGRKVQKLT
jgi:hypothetical protein